MNVSLFQAAAAMNANARWQDMISQNLASSVIPGFKKLDMTFEAVRAGILPVLDAAQNVAAQLSMPCAVPSVNFSQGQLKQTGVATDVALEGRGFFEVQLPSGNLAYTRDGEFHFNSQGQLVTKSGHLVMGDGGPLQIDQSNPAPLSISVTGELSQGAEVRGKLKVVDFNAPEHLVPLGAGYFSAESANLQMAPSATAALKQGFLESANISPVTEMAHLISVMRAFEANQKIMQMHDERMGRTINDLANPN